LEEERYHTAKEYIGHRSVSICHLGNIAIRFFPARPCTGTRRQQFTGEHTREAYSQFNRPYRALWQLEA
jgi:hypothetical protein